jgi:hypothetical protein
MIEKINNPGAHAAHAAPASSTSSREEIIAARNRGQ